MRTKGGPRALNSGGAQAAAGEGGALCQSFEFGQAICERPLLRQGHRNLVKTDRVFEDQLAERRFAQGRLRRGMTYDALGRRDDALRCYHEVLDLGVAGDVRARAQEFLNRPFAG